MNCNNQTQTESEKTTPKEPAVDKFDIGNIDFKALSQVNVRTVDRDMLVDLNDIIIDTSLPREQRMVEFLRQVKNPYCFKVGKLAVKVSYTEGRPTLEELLIRHIRDMY